MPTIRQFFGIAIQMFWIEWALEHRPELMEDWNLCQAKQHPKKIQPLE